MNPKLTILFSITVLLLTACSSAPVPQVTYDPASLRFDAQRAYAIENEFVTKFPDRASGMPNNRLAAEWLRDRFSELGWSCSLDQWEIVNYSRPVPLNNMVCRLPGESEREILLVAHHDQAPTTIQGADNDGSGIAILLHLAEIFAAEGPHPYTLVFISTDAEEYGMIGSRRYIQTHPDTEDIITGISLDNLGMFYYDGMDMDMRGQYRGYGPIWLMLTAREAAEVPEISWDLFIRSPLDQVIEQAAPVSFMDEGPMVAAGVPAIGLAGRVPPEYADLHYHLWHDPDDTMDQQSAEALSQSGLIAEALTRQLLSMDSFPKETGPYLYFDESRQVLRGLQLWLIFAGFTGLFFLGSVLASGTPFSQTVRQWRQVLPHFLGSWLPLLSSILLLYLFVVVGLMDAFHRYPATTKDPYLLNPRWPAIILYLLGLGVFLFLGRLIASRFSKSSLLPSFADIKSFSLFVVGLGGVYVLALNPFSLLFFVPLLFWFLIRARSGAGKLLDILFFLLGGLMVYALIYFFGFLTLRYNFAMLWYMMNFFSIRMISFPTASVITAIIAAGLSMVVNPPAKA